MAVGRDAFQLLYQSTPILLTGGKIPAWVPGVPILAATGVLGLASALVSGTSITNLDDSFAQFIPQAGSTVIDQQIATYPFANLSVAANSIVDQPKHITYQMVAPARGSMSYWLKLAQFEALIQALRWHNEQGGAYHLVSPSFIWFNCLMRNMRDTSSGGTKQVQNVWTLDFEQPLLTVEQANSLEQTMNSFLTNATTGQPPADPNNLIGQGFNAPTGTQVTQ